MIDMNTRRAFTLIEMLVVMAIMAIVAAMVVGMASAAKAHQHAAQVQAGLNRIRNAIDNYQAKLNFYPPDNGNLVNASLQNPNYLQTYDAVSAVNPLLYELMGGTNTNSGAQIQVFGTNRLISATDYQMVFGRPSLANAVTDQSPTQFLNPGPKPQDYAPLTSDFTKAPLTNYGFVALSVPVGTISFQNKATVANFWHYDASTTNRHNQGSYDLWAEYFTGTKNGVNIIVTNGNW